MSNGKSVMMPRRLAIWVICCRKLKALGQPGHAMCAWLEASIAVSGGLIIEKQGLGGDTGMEESAPSWALYRYPLIP